MTSKPTWSNPFGVFHHVGFFYVKNFGLNDEQIQQQFTLAKNFFNLPLEEKMRYECDFANGGYNGYRPSGRNKVGNVKDNVEIYNIPKFTKDFDGYAFSPWPSEKSL